MSQFLARARVLFKSAPTYLVAAATIVTIITQEIAKELSDDTAANVVSIGGKIVAIIGAAVAIIRRVTPVLPEERGMLMPPKPPNPLDPAFDEPGADHGFANGDVVWTIVGILAIFALAIWILNNH